MSASIAHAAPVLRVRATSHFVDLRATSQDDGTIELQGTLQDDLNQPIANATVNLPPEHNPRGCDGDNVITTDHQGKFCAYVNDAGGAMRVAFKGDGLLSESSASVNVQAPAEAPTSLTIETPLEWSRDTAQHVVNLAANTSRELYAELSLRREGLAPIVSPRVAFSGSRAVVEIATALLPAAGPLTLHAAAVTASGTVVSSTQLGIDVVSTIHLSLREPLPEQVRTGDELELNFELNGDPPVVDSGWVEVQADGANVAMVPVKAGRASVVTSLKAARQRTAQIRATFVPQFQFHIAGPALTQSLVVLGPRQWLHLPLAALILGFAWRLVRMWRRPAREPARATAGPVSGIARVVRHEVPTPVEGWQGVVVDAHTGVPIAGATVALVVPSLVSSAPARHAVTDDQGRFRFDKLTPLPEGSRFLVQGELHSTFEAPAPQPGVLEIALVARRRTLLAAVREWANLGPNAPSPEPTPLELARLARAEGDEPSAEWIRLVDEAVYGRDPVLRTTEATLLGRRPARVRSSSKGR